MITIEECESRIWNDDALFREALADHDSLPYWFREIRSDKDAMSRNERAWNLIEEAVNARAGAMADELNAEHESDAAHESRLIDEGNRIAVNADRY